MPTHAPSPRPSSSSPPTLFLTGGTGLVGSHVAELWSRNGWRVRALVRPRSDTRHLESLGCELVVGSLTRPDSFSGAAAGCEATVHAAARIEGDGGWEAFREVNVEGSRHVAAECLRSEVATLVHVSSIAVYGDPRDHDRRPIGEDAPTDTPLAPGSGYARSKRTAEKVVRRIAGRDLRWTVLRPGFVVGERDRHFTPRVVRYASAPLRPRFGTGENELPVVYAGNVALAAWLAVERPDGRDAVYNVTDDGPLTQDELWAEASRVTGRAGLVVPVPEWAALRGAAAAEWTAKFLPRLRGLLPDRRRMSLLCEDDPFDGTRLARELGWHPPTSTREGWKRALEWNARAAGR